MKIDTGPSGADAGPNTTGGYSQYVACAVALGVVFLLDLAIPLGVAVGTLYIVPLLFSLWISQEKPTIVIAIVSSGLIFAAFFSKPEVAEMWKVLLNRGIALFVVWATAVLALQRKKTEQQRNSILLEREKALKEIRILQGFLPICASCKKIRDDGGYWTQIEGYIKAHSEAEFTHSICPECAERLYPDFYGTKRS